MDSTLYKLCEVIHFQSLRKNSISERVKQLHTTYYNRNNCDFVFLLCLLDNDDYSFANLSCQPFSSQEIAYSDTANALLPL